MISIFDAVRLAGTKLRTRKVRLGITIVISGILFSALVAASLVMQGTFASLNYFNKQGLGTSYMVQGTPGPEAITLGNDEVLLLKATEAQKDLVARKKAEAKRLGIEYDATAEPPIIIDYDTPQGKVRTLDVNLPLARQIVEDYYASRAPGLTSADFKAQAAPYNGSSYYASKRLPFISNGISLRPLKDGVESFDSTPSYGNTGLDSFINQWTTMDDQLMRSFVLKGQDLQIGSDGAIPIIVPYSAARQLLKIPKTPESAPATTKLAAINTIRAQAPTATFSLCYRNASSASLVQKAQQQSVEIAQGKDKKDYKKPDLVYGLPTEACGAVPIVRDVRTAAQKTLDAKQLQFDELFGQPSPSQQTIRFRVVGLVPDFEAGTTTGVSQIISSLVTSNLGAG